MKYKIADNAVLVLSGHYDRIPGLDQFLLALIINGNQINEWRCTSSHVNGQQKGDQYQRGGLIPSVHHCRNLKRYLVNLYPEDSRHVKGVEGDFFRISPNEVTTIKGTKRSYFGIHLDANVPGSLGCPVMNEFNFDDFKKTIRKVVEQYGFTHIPFFPLYS